MATNTHLDLISTSRFVSRYCERCELSGNFYGGYYYTHLNGIAWIHKECVEPPLMKINHPSHLRHPLHLVDKEDRYKCGLCRREQSWAREDFVYSCSVCEFRLDLRCALRHPPHAELPKCYDGHPLVILGYSYDGWCCEVCKDIFGSDLDFYSCWKCYVHFHPKCVNLPKEVNHPCHSDHPLKFIALDSLSKEAAKTCILCGKLPKNVLYHCSICNFTTCTGCSENPPPLVINHTKTHKHPLTLFPKKLLCACNVCGKEDGVMPQPYVCLQCGFMVHGSCIDLPRVININRHDDRISFTPHLGHGRYSKCGVCRESVSPYYGAYTCSVCPDYAAHTHCATRDDVWDGIDLDGIPEDTEDISPFKVVGDNLIIHFLHSDHFLRLHKENIIYDGIARCEACLHSTGIDPIYSCEECPYILHEKCANLPKKKRLVFGTVPYILQKGIEGEFLECHQCSTYSTGFLYVCQREDFVPSVDVHCASLVEPFIHECHSHPLFFGQKSDHCCIACHREVNGGYMLSCEVCDFHLGLCCASLPKRIKHRNDEHPLTLCCGEKANGKYWCDICETRLDPNEWFYTCCDCGVTLHIKCVIGDFSRLKPGSNMCIKTRHFEVVLNNHNTRPLCRWCRSRCKADVILGGIYTYNICSRFCLFSWFEECDRYLYSHSNSNSNSGSGSDRWD